MLLVLLGLLSWQSVRAGSARQDASPTPVSAGVTLPDPAAIILEINNMRAKYGVQPLTVHPALAKIAQQEADGIAMGDPGHWRPYGLTLGQWMILEGFPLSGDITLDGYRSENWSMVTNAQGAIDQMHDWVSSNDEAHTNTMLSTERSDIGVGVSSSKDEYGQDQIFFVIETALRTATGQQQSEARDFLTSLPTIQAGAKAVDGTPLALSDGQYVIPVKVSTARPDGKVVHPVQSGQSLWSIAVFYHTTMQKIRELNGMGSENTIYEGQKLLVMKDATQPAPTATVTVTSAATPTRSRELSPTTTLTPVGTPAPAQAPAVTGNITPVIGVIFVAFVVLAGILASSMKVKG